TSVINDYVDDIFNLIWNCGIQIVLFVSGLQAIPEQLYEVSKVEGATKWEEFWYITTPMLRGTINLVLIFTVIDFCASNSNSVMRQAYTLLLEQQNYSQSSAIMWAFFAVVAVIFGVVLWLINRCIFKKWE
ncbi:MAG: ABC transporter permease subunit, partial [Oscillospiraceae bacterium]